jgi:hypothetical protein
LKREPHRPLKSGEPLTACTQRVRVSKAQKPDAANFASNRSRSKPLTEQDAPKSNGLSDS